MISKTIDIGKDFALYLGPRYREDGDKSGQEFLETLLRPVFLASDAVVIVLDSIKGYTASFMEEAFGGLVREYGLAPVEKKLHFVAAERAYLLPMIHQWMAEAAEQRRK